MTNALEAKEFVGNAMANAQGLQWALPAIVFVVACLVSFATGTSWGTFGILIPIVTQVFHDDLALTAETGVIPEIVIICISACLAGAVCGDHCSPISDTTIMASAGAQCDHVNHVFTQMPYAFTVAGVCAVGFLIAGYVSNVFAVLGISIALMIAVLLFIRLMSKRKKASAVSSESK